METAEDFSDDDESAGDGNQLETQVRRTEKDTKLQMEHRRRMMEDPAREEDMQWQMTEGKHISRGPPLSHQEIRQRMVQKDGRG